MVTRKTTQKIVLKEEKEPTIPTIIVDEPAKKDEKTVKKTEKPEPVKADLSNLTIPALKSIVAKVFDRLGAKPKATNVFEMLAEAGVLLKLEPYEFGKGADYTKEYLKRVLEKVNGK